VEAIHLLPPAERARRYRALAAEALEQAQSLPAGDKRDWYVDMALGWATLAQNCEKLSEDNNPPG
jgi:hypothetical protein